MGSSFGFGGSVSNVSSLDYLEQAIDLSKKIDYTKGIITARVSFTYNLNNTGNFPKALQLALENLKALEQYKDLHELFWQLRAIVWIWNRT